MHIDKCKSTPEMRIYKLNKHLDLYRTFRIGVDDEYVVNVYDNLVLLHCINTQMTLIYDTKNTASGQFPVISPCAMTLVELDGNDQVEQQQLVRCKSN